MYANVYNASGHDGEGRKVAERLGWRGLHILDVGNDPKADERPTPKYAEVRYGPAGRNIALNIAQQIPNANLFDDDRGDPSVDIVIGDKFALTPRPPAPIKQVKADVYNTTFVAGLAAKVAGELKQQGFTTDSKPNDKAYYPKDDAVIVYSEQGLPNAERLKMSVKGARLLEDTKAGVDMKGTDVRLYLGSKWPETGKVIPLSQATASPTPSPTSTKCK